MWISSPARRLSYRRIGSSASKPAELAQPIRLSTAETVEVAISRVSAISEPVIRSRRRVAIASTRSGGVVLWTRLGAELRSTKPASPFGAIAPHPLASGTRAHSGGLGRLRERDPLLENPPDHGRPALRAERRVSVNLQSGISLVLVASTPPASKEIRMNNVLRNYS
jgi:hypothetical protein